MSKFTDITMSKFSESRKVCAIAGLLLLNVSCATAASEQRLRTTAKRDTNDVEVGLASSEFFKQGWPYDERLFRFRWVKPVNDASPGWPELQYFAKEDLENPRKADGFKVSSGLYYRIDRVPERNGWLKQIYTFQCNVYALRLWSGALSDPRWLSLPYTSTWYLHNKFRVLEHLEKEAKKIDDDSMYWVQRLEFDTSAKRAQFIANLKKGLETFCGRECNFTKITSQADWNRQLKSARLGKSIVAPR